MATKTKNWFSKLQALPGAVTGDYNPHAHVIQTPSPSVNFCFGKGHGLPLGFTLALGGPPKGGKTLLCNATVGQLHQDDPEAVTIKFDTEFREAGQMSPTEAGLWGIDRERHTTYSVNSPVDVFDRIESDLAAMCQDGLPLKLVIIDSITGIQGRRAMNADTIATQQIGDQALTLQEGFKRILPVQRKYKFAVIITCHIRAEMDVWEAKRNGKFKMALPLGVQHYAEYFMYIEPNNTASARSDLSGNEFKDDSVSDLRDKGEQTGHKIRVKMKDSSCGPKGRGGEFTLDYQRGIINVYEEVFLLGTGRNVIEKISNVSYAFGDRKWTGGKPAVLQAIKDDGQLAKAILFECRKRDLEGAFAHEDAILEKALDSVE